MQNSYRTIDNIKMECKLPSKAYQTHSFPKKEVTKKLNNMLQVELIESRVTNREFELPKEQKQY